MTYAANLDKLSRTPITYATVTLDFCSRTFGVSPCTGTGAPCYNTFFTCKDQAHYGKTTQQYAFCSADAPLPWPGPRPYILSADYLPTEIKDSITVGARCKIELQDEPDTDVGIDPYVSQRTPPILGTYLKKLMARNPNYEGRSVAVYDGFLGDAIGEYQLRFKGKIDLMDFTGQGRFVIEAVDMLQALDQVDVPAKLDIKTIMNVDASQTSITFNDTSDLAGGDYFLLDDEVMKIGAITGDQVTGLSRAQFGTVAATHSNGGSVQKCRYFARQNPFDMLITMLETDGGYTSSDVDEAAFAYWKATPGGDVTIEALVTEPTRLSDLIKEICQLFDLRIWQAETQKITIMRPLPNNPDAVYVDLNDAANIVLASCSVKMNPKNYPVVVSSTQKKTGSNTVNASRVSRFVLRWDKNPTGKMDDDTTFARIDEAINAVSESANAYDSVAEAEIRTRWLRAAAYATEEELAADLLSLTSHYIFMRADPLPMIALAVELKDSDILVGSFVRLSTDEIVNADGSPIDGEKFVVVKREPQGSKTLLVLAKLPATRIGYIAADSVPDYDSATEAEREYGFITDDNGLINDKPGYYIW